MATSLRAEQDPENIVAPTVIMTLKLRRSITKAATFQNHAPWEDSDIENFLGVFIQIYNVPF